MIKNLWYYLFNKKKEVKLPNNDNRDESNVDSELIETLREHSESIARISSRISEISDEIALLKSDVSGFKRGVSRDMKHIIDTMKTDTE